MTFPAVCVGSSSEEKSPVRHGVGIRVAAEVEGGVLLRRLCSSMKKKSLSLMMWPPNVPPNWFQRSAERGTATPADGPFQLLAQEFEFSLSLRKYSKRSPWNLLVPDLITTLMMPPWKLPNSAEALFVVSLNSSMASGLGW